MFCYRYQYLMICVLLSLATIFKSDNFAVVSAFNNNNAVVCHRRTRHGVIVARQHHYHYQIIGNTSRRNNNIQYLQQQQYFRDMRRGSLLSLPNKNKRGYRLQVTTEDNDNGNDNDDRDATSETNNDDDNTVTSLYGGKITIKKKYSKLLEGSKKNFESVMRTATGDPSFQFGDILKDIAHTTVEEVKTTAENVVREVTGNENYKFGDITKRIIEDMSDESFSDIINQINVIDLPQQIQHICETTLSHIQRRKLLLQIFQCCALIVLSLNFVLNLSTSITTLMAYTITLKGAIAAAAAGGSSTTTIVLLTPTTINMISTKFWNTYHTIKLIGGPIVLPIQCTVSYLLLFKYWKIVSYTQNKILFRRSRSRAGNKKLKQEQQWEEEDSNDIGDGDNENDDDDNDNRVSLLAAAFDYTTTSSIQYKLNIVHRAVSMLVVYAFGNILLLASLTGVGTWIINKVLGISNNGGTTTIQLLINILLHAPSSSR